MTIESLPVAPDRLPETLPAEPLATVADWIALATATCSTDNPTALALATADVSGQPSLRFVLCRGLDQASGHLVFYTNRTSRKGAELTARPRAAATFYWDWLELQVRFEGPIVASPDAESDRYFANRGRDSQIAAWSSQQSEPLASREALLDAIEVTRARFADGEPVPRPPHWGGYRLYFESVELWVGGSHRVHDRARWTRTLAAPGAEASPWQATRLYP